MLLAVLGVLLCGRAVADDRCVGGWQMGDGDGDGGGAAVGEAYVGTYTSREACIDAVKSHNGGVWYPYTAAKYATSPPYYCYAEYGQKWVSYTSQWENCLFASDDDVVAGTGYIFKAGRCYPQSQAPYIGTTGTMSSVELSETGTPQECYAYCVGNSDYMGLDLWFGPWSSSGHKCMCNYPSVKSRERGDQHSIARRQSSSG